MTTTRCRWALRGLCYAKRALEVLDRVGVGQAVVDKGVEWNVGRTFFREKEVYSFNLLPEPDHKRPGMINLQQYYLEEYLVNRCNEVGIEIRWKTRSSRLPRQMTASACRWNRRRRLWHRMRLADCIVTTVPAARFAP